MERGPPGPPFGGQEPDRKLRVPADHKGWHRRGYLPHRDAAGLAQHVTFRLQGSLPASVVENLNSLGDDLDDRRGLIDAELDRCLGPTWLSDPVCASLVADALIGFDGGRYGLIAWCVMPNHVHVLIRQLEGYPLSGIVKSWKGYTARMANRHLRRRGPFWATDYFDRYVRDTDQLMTAIDYIEANPVKAGLCRAPENWLWSSASPRHGRSGPHEFCTTTDADVDVRAPS